MSWTRQTTDGEGPSSSTTSSSPRRSDGFVGHPLGVVGQLPDAPRRSGPPGDLVGDRPGPVSKVDSAEPPSRYTPSDSHLPSDYEHAPVSGTHRSLLR